MIRPAVMEDLESVEEAYHAHFIQEQKHGAYTVFQKGVYPTRTDAEKALRHEALYVYVDHGVVLGSMILDHHQPEEYQKIDWPSHAAADQVHVIHLLMVRPSATGKGIGSSLVHYALDMAKQHTCIAVRLDTGAQNIPAVSFYQKLGFQLVATSSMKVGGAISHNRHLFMEKIL